MVMTAASFFLLFEFLASKKPFQGSGICFVDISEGVVNSGVQAKSSRMKIKKVALRCLLSTVSVYLSKKTILSVGT